MKLKATASLLLLALLAASCGTSRRTLQPAATATVEPAPAAALPLRPQPHTPAEEAPADTYPISSLITSHAREFLGTRYKFGGTTSSGMDCSGLVYTAFRQHNIELPRISREMSLLGTPLNLEEVGIGDLLFFETDPRKKTITHVGLVVDLNEQDIFFIHATNSQGVVISSLSQAYWKNAFVLAKRVL